MFGEVYFKAISAKAAFVTPTYSKHFAKLYVPHGSKYTFNFANL